VRPEYSGLGEGKLREKAQSSIDKTISAPKNRYRKAQRRLAPMLKLIAAAAGGGTVTALILLLCK